MTGNNLIIVSCNKFGAKNIFMITSSALASSDSKPSRYTVQQQPNRYIAQKVNDFPQKKGNITLIIQFMQRLTIHRQLCTLSRTFQ